MDRSSDGAVTFGRPVARAFFERDPVTCARELVGCVLVWGRCAGVVVETEAYAAEGDEACHTFSRPSARRFVARHRAGAAYVYFNYGMHWLFNVLVKGGGSDGFVLVRAVEPLAGVARMRRRRGLGAGARVEALCSGPGKLARAFGIGGSAHGRDLCAPGSERFRHPSGAVRVETCVRVGISRARGLRWRFLLAGSRHVSKKPEPAPRGAGSGGK